MSVREYSGNAKATKLNGAISNTDTALVLVDGTGYPTGGTGAFVITLDVGLAAEEKILCTARAGNNVTVTTRGYDGTTAAAHDNQASVTHTISAVDLREANAHGNTGAAVHGLAGSVVGTTDTQTLSNKTLTTPTIGSLTNAQHDHSNAAGGAKLAQANTHQSPDTDTGTSSLHHTLGTGANQASAGNHTHAASTAFIGCMAYLAGANQTFTTAVETSLLWDAESFDTSAFHSTASNKERFTIPAGLDGYYEITAVIRWSHNATGRRNVSIKKNGTTYLAEHNVTGDSGDTTGGLIQHISVVVYLVAGDYISITGTQASGGNLDVPAATAPSYAIVKRLGT